MGRWLLALLLLFPAPAAAEPLRVYVASSLTETMHAVADLWAKRGHERPVLVLAASSALARQIEAGAPAGVFVSADREWMDYLAARNRIAKGTRRDLLTNRLVLVVPRAEARALALRRGFDMAALVGERRWATGDPETVPVGRYAKAALTSLGNWDAAEKRLARAENVRSALAFVERGDVAAGIVYATDARASGKVAVAGVFPASSHPPIVYPAAVIAPASGEALAFSAFLRSAAVKAVFRRAGFGVR